MRRKLAAAERELRTLSRRDVDAEVAWTWAARSAARRRRHARLGLEEDLLAADDARGEALEHAAKAEDGGATVAAVERWLDAEAGRSARGRRPGGRGRAILPA